MGLEQEVIVFGDLWGPSGDHHSKKLSTFSHFSSKYVIFSQKCTFRIYHVIFHQDFEWNRTSIKQTWKKFPDINPPKKIPIPIPNIPLKPIKINPNLLKYSHFSRKSPKIIIIHIGVRDLPSRDMISLGAWRMGLEQEVIVFGALWGPSGDHHSKKLSIFSNFWSTYVIFSQKCTFNIYNVIFH